MTVDPALGDRLPLLSSTPAQLWLAGMTRSLVVDAFNPDGDAVTMALNTAGLPGGLTFASTLGTGRRVITWNTSGVAPGLYSLPVQAAANGKQAQSFVSVKIAADNPYWRWVGEKLSTIEDLAMTNPAADADGDGIANIHEWAFFGNLLEKDALHLELNGFGELCRWGGGRTIQPPPPPWIESVRQSFPPSQQ